MVLREIVKFLVVDTDKAYAKYLQGALEFLGCKVTTCNYQEQALTRLHDQKQRFDIVVADAKIPFEMGFKFVEIVSSKINLPTIMMCSASDKEIISAGMNLGACQVAVKPVGIKEVQQFLQCALENRRQHLLGVSNSPSNSEGLHGLENGSNQMTTVRQLYKNRLVWTEDLNALFVEAVHALGGKDIAVPRKIMEQMNVPNLTRENIASHLQKYRLYSDPNYVGGKRKRKAGRPMVVNRTDEQGPVIAHPDRRLLSSEAPEFGHRQGAYFEEPKIAQFPVMPQLDNRQHLFGTPNVQPYVPEPPAQSVTMQGTTMPAVFRDSRGHSLPAQSSLELQVPSDGIRSQEIPTSLDQELESFLAMDLSDPNFPFFNGYPRQYTSMISEGLSNGLRDYNYPVGLNDRITNDPANDSLIKDNPEANNPVAMQYPQNITATGCIFDHSNCSGQQQQEQIGGSPLEQPASFSGLGRSEPSPFGQGTRNGYDGLVRNCPGPSNL